MSATARALCCLGVAATLAGCGGSPEPAAPSGSAPTTSASTPASAPASATPTTPAATPSATPSNAPVDSSVKVHIHAPVYDSPGALVPVIPTAADAKSFEVSVGGTPGTCTGVLWTHATGTSQQCWVTIPSGGGKSTIDVRAHLGARDALGTLGISGKGQPAKAVDDAARDRILTCGNASQDVWLTFDDGFLSDATMNRVLATLKAENVRGRFFGTGQWARANPNMVATIQAAGHLVENHTDTHESLNAIDDAALQRQIDRGPATHPTLIRPGFGAGAFTTRVSAAAAKDGQGVCYWDVDTRDWAGPSADEIVHRVLVGDASTPPARAGSVVLMHMTGKHTPEALPGLIRGLREKGLTLPKLN